jgi:hypothetical protein
MYKSLLILIVLLGINNIVAKAQNNTNSPYSMFGLGLVNSSGDSRSFGMGGTGIAMPSQEGMNTLNPASLGSLDSLAFYINFQLKSDYSTISSSNQTASSFNTNFENMSFGFKANKWWGVGFGLTSFSNIGYSIITNEYLFGTDQKYNMLYEGAGGISDVYLTNSFRLTKNFSAGVDASFLWGSIISKETADYSNLNGTKITNTRTYHLNNIHLKYGLQYHGLISSTAIFAGATYSRRTNLYTTYDQTIVYNKYELYNKMEPTNDYLVPNKLGVGLGLAFKKSWTVAADYQFDNWDGLSRPYQNAKTKDAQKFSAGIEYAPYKNQFSSIFNRMKYRAGAFMNDTYLSINNYDLQEKGFSVGVSIPMRQLHNSISVSYQYKVIGTTSNGLLKETHNTIKIGFIWCEDWFSKSKFN